MRWVHVLVLIGLGGLPALGQAPAKPAAPPVDSRLPKETQAAQLALKAEDQLRAGKYPEAAALLQQAAELVGDDWALWDQAGWTYVDAEQIPKARHCFDKVREVAPAGIPSFGGLVITSYLQGDAAGVQKLLKQQFTGGVATEALAVAAKGLAAPKQTPDWNYGLAFLYGRVLRNSRRGIVPAEAVAQANPKLADAWLLLVEMNRDLNRADNINAAAIKYLELAPETVDAYRLRGERYVELRQFGNAAAEYQAGIKKHPLADMLYSQLARVQERMGNAKEAEATYQKLAAAAAGAKRPELQLQARTQLANFQIRRGNYAAAEAFYREAAALPEAGGAVWSTWGSLQALLGKWEAAAKALETAVERDRKARGADNRSVRDDLLTTRYHAAVCRLVAGQREAAVSGIEAALAFRSDVRTTPQAEAAAFQAWLGGKPGATDSLAYQRGDERWALFTWRKELEEGEVEATGRYSPAAFGWRAVLQQVRQKHPDCWPGHYALARILASAGATDDALALLERATQQRRDWWAPYFALAQYYVAHREKERGLPIARRAAELAPECRQARTYVSFLTNLKDSD
jgi:tetratricopeptide (TPR) repeat protein